MSSPVTSDAWATIKAALFYHSRGWVPVRVGYQGKRPIGGDGWQNRRPTREDIAEWPTASNVGVLLGAASGGLTDIDLDCPEANELASDYLPDTWVFGRKSKPRAHWLYVCEGVRTRQFKSVDGRMMLEMRGEASTGSGNQTVMPPSVHMSGETIEWDPDFADGAEGPRVIAYEELACAFAKLARGVRFMQLGATPDQARAKVAAYRPQPRKRAPGRRRVHHGAEVLERARRYLAKMEPAISGQGGHTALFKAAIALVKGFQLDEGTALELLKSEFNPRCQPAWRDTDLERKVREATNKSTVAAGYLLDRERRGA